jgi:hypothetical protein
MKLYEIVDKPTDWKVVDSKWVFRRWNQKA